MISAYVLAKVEAGKDKEILSETQGSAGVLEATPTYGVYDLHLKVEFKTIEELDDFIFNKIRRIPGVKETVTLIAFRGMQMHKIGCREIYFAEAKQPQSIDFLIDKVKEVISGMTLPPEYDVRIYKNVYACCGVGGHSLIIEVIGPEEEKIKAIDLRAVSKILEICEKEGYQTGHHSLGEYESL